MMKTNFTKISETFCNFLEWIPCDLCGGNDFDVIYPSTYSSSDFSENRFKSFTYADIDRARGNIVRCKNCQLVYMNPRDKKVDALYQEVEDSYYFSSRDERVASFECDLKNIEQTIGKPSLERNKLLDIGCSYGFFLDVAKNNGWSVSGCELSKKQFAFAATRHQGVFNRELKACPFEPNFFDLITLFDVIEHVPSPTALLQDVWRVLKPGGWVVMTTPDLASWTARCMGRYWINFVRMHLYYFSPTTMRALIVKTRFCPKKIVRHERQIKLGVAVEWTKKYPFIYNPLHLFFANHLTRNWRLQTRLSGNMLVYAQKI